MNTQNKLISTSSVAAEYAEEQRKYEQRERIGHGMKMRQCEGESLADRKAARQDFTLAIGNPALVAERIGWLLNGTYGFGSMKAAEEIARNKRMNREAGLVQMIAALEWQCPQRFAIEAWKTLGTEEQLRLDEMVNDEILEWEEHDNMLAGKIG